MSPYIRQEAASAQWMNPEDLEGDYFTMKEGRILLGKTKAGRTIGIDDNRHIVTVAGSRAGKSVTSLLSNLLTWKGSVITIDPKGELATSSAMHRAAMGQDVYILDPFGEVKGEAAKYRATFNPFGELRHADPDDVIDDAAMISDAIITNDGRKDDHWSMSARNMVRGIALYILHINPENASLVDVRDIINAPLGDDDKTPDDDGNTWLSTRFKLMMKKKDAFDGVVAGVGGTMHGKPKGERGSIVSTAVEQTSFLDSTPMRRQIKNSEGRSLPSLRVLKQKPTSIYLVLPASRMATHFKWLRLLLMQAMAAMEREENKTRHPILFILEEFPTLGHMSQIEKAAGLMAGYDVKLWTVMQDLSQIKALYPNSWETFLGNAGIIEAFGNSDTTTTEYLSKRLGVALTRMENPATLSLEAKNAGAPDINVTNQHAPLMHPFEITQAFSRDHQNKLVLIPERPPFSVSRIYWKDLLPKKEPDYGSATEKFETIINTEKLLNAIT